MPTAVDMFATRGTRSSFVGGSDARIIMGNDEGALLRLWHEKRGEAEPVNLSGMARPGFSSGPSRRC
jgi:hypothetical protein